jgi:dihydrofolate reductase
MRKVIYEMNVSLDGYVETADHDPGWAQPDEELFRFINEEVRAQGAFLYGRRLYDVMASHWPTAEATAPPAPDYMVEFAEIWREKPKVVFSRTLTEVAWNARLVRDDIAREVADLKDQPGGDLSVGGPTLAAALILLGLVDEYRLLVHPIVLGGGTPFFPPLDGQVQLRLLETRTFGSGVAYLRYARADT